MEQSLPRFSAAAPQAMRPRGSLQSTVRLRTQLRKACAWNSGTRSCFRLKLTHRDIQLKWLTPQGPR